LTGEVKTLYEQWRSLGYTQSAALDRVERSDLVHEERLYRQFRDAGLSPVAASMAAIGRDGPPLRPVEDSNANTRLVKALENMAAKIR
jgi:hypothetical protein